METLYETMSNYYKYNNIDWNYYLNDLAFPKNVNDARKFIDDFSHMVEKLSNSRYITRK